MKLFFISLLIFLSSVAAAEPFMKLSIGQGIRHQDNHVSELSFVSGAWALSIAGISSGETANGYQEFNNIFSLTKTRDLYRVGNFSAFYMRVGVASVEGSNLVGPWDYRSGVGFRHKGVALEFNHISSGSLYRTNQGIDYLALTIDF